VITLTDPADERLDDYRDLRRPGDRVRYEARVGCFIAEGLIAVRRLLASPLSVRSVLVLATKFDRVAGLVPSNVPCYVVSGSVLAEVAGFDVHRGVLACADRPAPADLGTVAAEARTIAVLEGLNDHENLGAIARSARALGVDALMLDPTCADPWYRRTVRVSMGEVLALPVVRSADWPGDLDRLRGFGFTVVALTPASDAVDLWELAADPPERIALLLGAEGPGLSTAAIAAADIRVRIPIRAGVDSLNVGHAAAVAFAALGRRAP
jgi:tRNA G18 (ribose-2'-O)-methylase SpoU